MKTVLFLALFSLSSVCSAMEPIRVSSSPHHFSVQQGRGTHVHFSNVPSVVGGSSAPVWRSPTLANSLDGPFGVGHGYGVWMPQMHVIVPGGVRAGAMLRNRDVRIPRSVLNRCPRR